MNADQPLLVVDRVVKRFGAFTAVDHVSLTVRRGEVVSLLGPSGCGKTSTLRLIAGFLQADEGEIRLAGRIINHVPPYRRDLGVVFQSYALFSHLTVGANVAFGLRTRRVASREIAERVAEALALVRLEKMEMRYPHELSGGQQQRVAIARAIVVRPTILLLDEPLSSLDALLRSQMQLEMRRIIDRAQVTAIFVTHDQHEALSISDRIIVMSQGRVEQEGTPPDVYAKPANAFVATFLGRSNLVRVAVARREGETLVVRTEAGTEIRIADIVPSGRELLVLQIRPEALVLSQAAGAALNCVDGEVMQSAFLGSTYEYVVRAAGTDLLVHAPTAGSTKTFARGDRVTLHWRTEDMRVLAADGEAHAGVARDGASPRIAEHAR
jgi:putative spermidine/putrescine transport system ATP-binding protein